MSIRSFPPADEISLNRAPLVKVLAQIRFEPILAIQSQANLSSFQDLIRESYPVLRSERGQASLELPGHSIVQFENSSPIWRFQSLDKNWIVSLSTDFMALETSAYVSRTDFLERLELVSSALSKTFKPGVVNRVGIRYLNRLAGDSLGQLASLIRPELVGVLNGELDKSIVNTSLSQSVFVLGSNQLFVRWGLLPPHSTADVSFIPPMDVSSWILDIDSAHSEQKKWDQHGLSTVLKQLSSEAYNFFRWATTEELLRTFGGRT